MREQRKLTGIRHQKAMKVWTNQDSLTGLKLMLMLLHHEDLKRIAAKKSY